MSPQIILTVVQGKLRGQRFVFRHRTMCTIGRGKDCSIHVPDDDDHRMISRQHCVLDIAPPRVRIRDLGSRNGTFVNGEKIGQRQPDQAVDGAFLMESKPVDLEDGDDIQVGHTIFNVKIRSKAACALCEHLIAPEDRDYAEWAPGVFVCEKCREKGDHAEKLGSSLGSAVPV